MGSPCGVCATSVVVSDDLEQPEDRVHVRHRAASKQVVINERGEWCLFFMLLEMSNAALVCSFSQPSLPSGN